MKIEKFNIDGKKENFEVLDKLFSAKINKQLISNVIYKA
jgi:large subunit ribosomal protein L4